MAHTTFTTFISGFNTAVEIKNPHGECPLDVSAQFAWTEKNSEFFKMQFVQTHRRGVLKPATIEKMIEKLGIVRG